MIVIVIIPLLLQKVKTNIVTTTNRTIHNLHPATMITIQIIITMEGILDGQYKTIIVNLEGISSRISITTTTGAVAAASEVRHSTAAEVNFNQRGSPLGITVII